LNTAAKGRRAEHRCRDILEAAGYSVLRAAGSFGAFDLIALNSSEIRLINVKSGSGYASGIEREVMKEFRAPPYAVREIWRFPDRCKHPLIEVL
jgi:Holliday junction resolvase